MKILIDHTFLLSQQSPLNRGRWTFTSLVTDEKDFILLDEHLERLQKGAHFLFPECQWSDERHTIEIKNYLKEQFQPHFYYRINLCESYVWVYKKPHVRKSTNVKLALSQNNKYTNNLPSYVKIPNYLNADLEMQTISNDGFDEIFYLDEQGFLTEASTSNLFIVKKNGDFFTPKASSKVLSGIMRRHLIKILESQGKKIEQIDLFWNDGKFLDEVREIWLTNSVNGIRFVDLCGKRNFIFEGSELQTFLESFDHYGRARNGR